MTSVWQWWRKDSMSDTHYSIVCKTLRSNTLSYKFITILRTCSASLLIFITYWIWSDDTNRILGACPSKWSWFKASLPVAVGGTAGPISCASCLLGCYLFRWISGWWQPLTCLLLFLFSTQQWVSPPLETWILLFVRKPCHRPLISSLINASFLLPLMIGLRPCIISSLRGLVGHPFRCFRASFLWLPSLSFVSCIS